MDGKTICGIIIVIILAGMFIPFGSSEKTGDNSVAVTYGETTYYNENYKSIVDNYFKSNSNADLSNANQTIITANDVNKISADISQRTYNSNQILSCAMVDLSSNNDINIDVDKSKITTVTPSMYKSALKSSGITKGNVIVTSPTTATGESALAGVMKSYETATGKEIPEDLKNAANKEIYAQSQVVNDTNASADDVAELVEEVKNEVAKENTTDHNTIITIINNIASNNNIQISDNDINILADSIQDTQEVKDQAVAYQSQISDYINSSEAQSIMGRIWNIINTFINNYTHN
ncbi:MAG: hypothetical protein BZ136_05510 [Methanosphaera sp. rholeuAM74]|nr:MAG: hypothetical protein BZ136_05510 [Methanosphaera sp. rholeuAM74]